MLVEPIFAQARRRPQDVAIVDDRGQYTWGQLAASVAGLGAYLQAQTRAPRVGLLLPTSGSFVASFYATLLAGKAVVPINFLLSDREIAHCIADAGIDTIISIPLLAGRLKDTPLKVIDITALPVPPSGAFEPKVPQVRGDDPAAILYTSGTSGLPKGVVLSHSNLKSDALAAIRHAGLAGQPSFLGIIPLFHSTGLLATMIAPVEVGAKMVYQARFSPLAVIEAVKTHQIAVMAAVPSMYGAMARLKDVDPSAMASLKLPLSGGEPLPAVIRDAFELRFGVPLYEGYGLTETCGPIAVNVPSARKPGSVGKLLPGAQVRFVDDDERPLGVGEIGEIQFRGPMVMSGYFNQQQATSQVMTPDGWLRTGDLGQIDAEGFLTITGRKKDLIIVAGEKAYPGEIEEVIQRLPQVADASVVGRKDKLRGEAVVAFVTPKEGQTVTPADVDRVCRESGLPRWKCPSEVYVVQDLPRSPTGKVLKRVLIENLAAAAPTDGQKQP